MFQNNNESQALEHILRTQLDYFNSVLTISEKVVKQVEQLPVKVLSEMVNYRKEWIEKIQELENQRKSIAEAAVNDVSKALMKDISHIASKLVQIDDKIYKNLEQRKLAVIQESAGIAEKARQTRRAGDQLKGNINRINIIHE